MIKKTVCICVIFVLLFSLCGCNGATVEFSYFDGQFSPFFAQTPQDLSVVALTQESLLVTTSDESASPWEDASVAQPVYDAHAQGLGIADIELSYGVSDTLCTIKIGEDVCFSDGVKLTAKDVAFSLYVYAQADYNGWSSLKDCAIDGLKAYQYGTEQAEEVLISAEEWEEELAHPCARTSELLKERIILPVLRAEYLWVTHLYGDDAYRGTDVEQHRAEYSDPRALFAYYYALDKGYDPLAADAETLINDIAAQYGNDYKLLGTVYGADLSAAAQNCAVRALTEQALEGVPKTVDHIRGIQIVDDSTLTVKINSKDPSQLQNVLGVYVAPFHYYGEGCVFNGRGFTIDLASVAQKNDRPLGAGRYVFKSYDTGGVRFVKNSAYYRETELASPLCFQETGNSNVSTATGYYVTVQNRMYVKNNA